MDTEMKWFISGALLFFAFIFGTLAYTSALKATCIDKAVAARYSSADISVICKF